jgi:carbon storage regulator CsrA
MLVLTRRKDESILIKTASGVIRVANLGIDRNQVNIGIGCRRDIPILRYEIANIEWKEEGLTDVERICGALDASNIEEAIKKAKKLMEKNNG